MEDLSELKIWEIYKLAIDREVASFEFYSQAEKISREPGAKSLFSFLAGEEKKT